MGKSYTKPKLHDTFGITVAEKKLFMNTWEILRLNPGYYSVNLFLIFFDRFPEHQSYYKRFKFEEIPDLKAFPDLTLHGLKVMRQFSAIADYIDKPEMLIQILYNHTMSHTKRHISIAAYSDFRLCFMQFLTTKLNVSGEVLQAWNKVLTTLFRIITDMNNELQLDVISIDRDWHVGNLM